MPAQVVNLEQVSVHDVQAAEGAHALGRQRGRGGSRGRGRGERRGRVAVVVEDVVRAGGAHAIGGRVKHFQWNICCRLPFNPLRQMFVVRTPEK